MGDRDYKVVYRTRTLDRDEPRPRIPTALDPHDYPYISDLSPRRSSTMRGSSSTIDGNITPTETTRAPTRPAYSARDGDSPRRSIVSDPRRDDRYPRRSEPSTGYGENRDKGFPDDRQDVVRGSGRDYYIDSRPRQPGAPYVVDARYGDILDVTVAGRPLDRNYDKLTSRYTIDGHGSSDDESPPPRRRRASRIQPSDAARNGNFVVIDKHQPTYARVQYDEYRSPRSKTREVDDRDEEWRMVESRSEARIGNSRVSGAIAEPPSRGRAPTYSSEDSYVLVPKDSNPPKSRARSRSAIARKDYPEPERQQRRSRSISFRGSQVDYHDCNERRHERPGAEAQILGRYLREQRMNADDDERSDTYAAYRETDRRSDAIDAERFAATYRDRDEPYGPQMDYNPRRRDASRHRRRETRDNDDDRSYYSENIRKTTKETTYR